MILAIEVKGFVVKFGAARVDFSPSESRVYFSDSQGSVFQLPFVMKSDHASPIKVK